MAESYIDTLTLQSTLDDLPSYSVTLDMERRGKEMGRLFESDPRLPGIVVMTGDQVRSVVSRGQFLRLMGRHFGREVFEPRPIRLMLETLDAEQEPLVLPRRTGIQAAAAAALGRPQELMYEPIVVRRDPATPTATTAATNLSIVDFPDLLRADSRISTLRRLQMRQILATVEEGFVMVDGDYRIADEYSSSLERILQVEQLAGRHLPDVLAPLLGDRLSSLCAGYLGTLFNANVIERLVKDINPLTSARAVLPDGQERFLRFGFVRSLDEDGSIRRLLVRVADITREVEQEQEKQETEHRTRERMSLIFEIVKADPHRLVALLRRLDQDLERLERLSAQVQVEGAESPEGEEVGALLELRRLLHGLKGEAGLAGLDSLQSRIHRAEDLCMPADESELELRDLQAAIQDLLEAPKELRDALEQLAVLGDAQSEKSTAPTLPPVPKTAPAPSLLADLAHLTDAMARRLGKPTRFVTQITDEQIPAPYRVRLKDVLIQMLRNAMVHGIETPAQRLQAGKPSVATLQLALREHAAQGRLELIFQDDGRGLDLDGILHKARDMGLQVGSREQAVQLIFEKSFSTAGQTDLDAGRGIGLDLARAVVRDLGGDLFAHSEPGVFCAFQILLPLSVDHLSAARPS